MGIFGQVVVFYKYWFKVLQSFFSINKNMFVSMLIPTKQHKILYAIVCFILVNVVNMLSRYKFSTKMFLHDYSMLKELLVIYCYSFIPVYSNKASTSIRIFVYIGATVFSEKLVMPPTQSLSFHNLTTIIVNVTSKISISVEPAFSTTIFTFSRRFGGIR